MQGALAAWPSAQPRHSGHFPWCVLAAAPSCTDLLNVTFNMLHGVQSGNPLQRIRSGI